MGAYDHISTALAEGLPETPTRLAPGFSGLLAVDAWGGWGAGYYLRINEHGQWSSDIYVVEETESGWGPVGDGGAHGEGWPTEGWTPDVGDIDLERGPSHLVGTVDAKDDDLLLRAQAGYAGAGVGAVRLDVDSATRVVVVSAKLRAFVAIGPADAWQLIPLDGEFRPIGPPLVIDASV